jgi:hypothetical protein
MYVYSKGMLLMALLELQNYFFVLQSHSSCWLVDKATASEICDLAHVIDAFTEQCEKVSGKTSTALRSVFKVQVCDIYIYSFIYYVAH